MHVAITSPRACLLAASLLFAPAVADAQADERPKTRPGIGPTPAFTCLSTTITEGGTTRVSKVTRPSGNLQRDNAALKFARRLRFIDPDGGRYTGGEPEVTLLVRMHQSGRFAWRSFQTDEELPEICSTPAKAWRS